MRTMIYVGRLVIINDGFVLINICFDLEDNIEKGRFVDLDVSFVCLFIIAAYEI